MRLSAMCVVKTKKVYEYAAKRQKYKIADASPRAVIKKGWQMPSFFHSFTFAKCADRERLHPDYSE